MEICLRLIVIVYVHTPLLRFTPLDKSHVFRLHFFETNHTKEETNLRLFIPETFPRERKLRYFSYPFIILNRFVVRIFRTPTCKVNFAQLCHLTSKYKQTFVWIKHADAYTINFARFVFCKSTTISKLTVAHQEEHLLHHLIHVEEHMT